MFQGYLLHKVVFFLTATGQLFDKTPSFYAVFYVGRGAQSRLLLFLGRKSIL